MLSSPTLPHTAGSDTAMAYSNSCSTIADLFGQADTGNIDWHPILSIRRWSSSYTCYMVCQKQGPWFLSFHAGFRCLSLHFQDFVSCYGLWELSCIPDNSSICLSSIFIFRPYCAVCYCLIAHSTAYHDFLN